MTPLNRLIREHYGSQKQLAEKLGVAEHTIVRWVKREPTYFLKHAFDMSTAKNDRDEIKFVSKLATAVKTQLAFISEN